jgi:hypothetical protein
MEMEEDLNTNRQESNETEQRITRIKEQGKTKVQKHKIREEDKNSSRAKQEQNNTENN